MGYFVSGGYSPPFYDLLTVEQSLSRPSPFLPQKERRFIPHLKRRGLSRSAFCNVLRYTVRCILAQTRSTVSQGYCKIGKKQGTLSGGQVNNGLQAP